jgi:hypothetical protein
MRIPASDQTPAGLLSLLRLRRELGQRTPDPEQAADDLFYHQRTERMKT